jgi:peptide/nickel transport system permease protein
MVTYIIRRLIQSLIVLFLVSMLVFFAMRLLPGDPILMLVASNELGNQSQEQIQQLKQEYGLDKPIIRQYFDWVGGVFRGDLGVSILNHRPVVEDIFRRLVITLHLGIIAFIFGNLFGVILGVLAAVRRGTWLDSLVTILSNLGMTLPIFWIGILMIYIFGLYFKILPTMGYTSPFENFWLSTQQLVMPVICLTIFPIAGTARQTRSSFLEVMHQDYIRTAWSKGLRERAIIIRHALKNALIPVATLMGMNLSLIVGGAVLIETVFNIPGIGRLLVSSVTSQDYPYVQGIILIIAAFITTVNLVVDLTYGWLDPRIRYS